MGSTRRRWVWLAIVAVLAVIWWLVPQPTSPSPSSTPDPSPSQSQGSSVAEQSEKEPEPSSRVASERPARPGQEEPLAMPLPRDEIELLPEPPALDGGVASEESIPIEQRRDAMLATVLDRLRDELRAAEESGNDQEAARLKIRIERLSERRDELAEP